MFSDHGGLLQKALRTSSGDPNIAVPTLLGQVLNQHARMGR
jgi:hypothetical protein